MMMDHSLKLESNQLLKIYQRLKDLIPTDLFKKVFLDSADNINKPINKVTLAEIDERIGFICGRGCQVKDCEIIYRMISLIASGKIISLEDLNQLLTQTLNDVNPKRIPHRTLAVREDGTWEIIWQIPEMADGYSISKFDAEIGEIIPESVVEILQSVFICILSQSYIAAMALALVALEATLWDHLALVNFDKKVVIEKFPHRVSAKLKWDGNQYLLSLIDHTGTPKSPNNTGSINFEIARTGMTSGNLRLLSVEIEDSVSEWLSTSDDCTQEEKERGTLSTAIKKARKEGLIPDNIWTSNLDNTIIALRNNLMHQSSDVTAMLLTTPHGEFRIGEISEHLNLLMFFVERIIQYIKYAYYEIGIANL
jgi:hypothetical protein